MCNLKLRLHDAEMVSGVISARSKSVYRLHDVMQYQSWTVKKTRWLFSVHFAGVTCFIVNLCSRALPVFRLLCPAFSSTDVDTYASD